ncbi:hypothetical protein CO674_29195 [Rhizobium hidalgonense]|uniref:Uncharacterized protein n=1 Tax=Rhizobium hidalgonense TaxID=1538159 RepID=A0ABX4JJZ7_9HYPH|nr:hypothetical protein CO674_29195 [Rhizobium hidalgonense]PON06458.1 hypothetical protein ATY29_16735 [Rhizobium hidalgonense]
MFLRHNPSSLCNTTGAHLAVASSAAISSSPRDMLSGRGILDIAITGAANREGCVKIELLSNFALHSASRQPA